MKVFSKRKNVNQKTAPLSIVNYIYAAMFLRLAQKIRYRMLCDARADQHFLVNSETDIPMDQKIQRKTKEIFAEL